MRKITTVLMLGCVLVCGCPFFDPPPPPAAAVLEGTWSVVPEDPGEFEGWEYEARFNSNGNMDQLTGVRPEDGATASLSISGAVTLLQDGTTVTITVPDPTGTRVFDGTLSSDQNTMTGSVTDKIDLGDLEASLPGGNLTFERIVNDPCEGVTCGTGESCVDGECVADDPCEGVTCGTGESCIDGECVADDPCEGVTCGTGESCVDGECVADDPCEGVTCGTGESCIDGECVPDTPTPDPAAGEAFYFSNGCEACHGDSATGPPSLVGVSAQTIFDKLSGAEPHVGGTVDGVTEQDSVNVAAWIASLGTGPG